MQKKVLFVGHSSLRTGAPLILLNFLKWFSGNSSIPFRILLKESGELDSDYQALAPLSIFKNRQLPVDGWQRRVPFAWRFQFGMDRLHAEKLRKTLTSENIGLIYSNTITNGEILEFLSTLDCPVITHVHELDYWIQRAGPHNLDQVRQYTDRYIVVSEAVKRNLVINHNISEELIEVVYGFVPTDVQEHDPALHSGLRKRCNIPDDAFVVGSSGHETWRKGKDLFVQLTLNTVSKHRDRPVHFVWIGGRTDDEEFDQIRYDMQQSGMADNIHFISHVADPQTYFKDFDVFAMTSREDPFPLVNLEAAALGKPIICFDNAGGTPEFVGNDAGFVVPYLDVGAMADRIIELANDEALRKKMGSAASDKVRKRHDISVGGAGIMNVIHRFL